MCKNVFLDAPNVGQLEKEYLTRAIESGFISTVGSFVPDFEKQFADYVGAKKAVSTQSGTAALHIALYELGMGKGDEVILPAITFVASINPILYVGAKPVIVDVDPKTWTIDPQETRKAITSKTKAIIPVHLYGNPCEMGSLKAIAKEYELYIIEDATESLGATYDGKQTGTFGDFGCFSFNGNKIITTGGGGMVISNDEERIEHIRFLVNQAKSDSEECNHSEIGFNYKMTNIEAALGLAQMEQLGVFLAKKKAFNRIYKDEVAQINCIGFQQVCSEADSSCWLNGIVFNDRPNIEKLQAGLHAKGIPTRRIFMPLTEYGPYQKYAYSNCVNSYHIYQNGLGLPSSTLNSEDGIYYVCETLRGLL